MEVKNVEEIKQNLLKINYPLFQDIKESVYRVNEKEYIDKEFLVQDPDGYLLRFTEE